MGRQFERLSAENKQFIKSQKLFFVASCSGKEVNLSPRGYDCFRVISDNEAIFLDYYGSGNRTATDILNNGELTVVFCSFDETPHILRLFCKGEVLDKCNPSCAALFENTEGVRQFIKLNIYCVEQSCGMSVPIYEFKSERNTIRDWCIEGEKTGAILKYYENKKTPPDLTNFRK